VSVRHRGLLIGDGEVSAASGERVDVRNPATGELIGSTAVAGAADVDAAVASARRALPHWQALSAPERGRVIHRGADLVAERADEIARMLTLEQGKPLADSVKEISFAIEVLRYYADEGVRVGGSVRPSARSDIRSIVQWLPVGVVAAVVPWNYPVDLYAWKVGPALAGGNAIVVKPPLETPLAAGMFAQCLRDGGLPAGLLADLPGAVEAGERMSGSPDIDMITATCSTRTGQAIMRSAATTMKRVALELGGQCPFIVLDDADVADAAAAAARRSFSNAGQICIAVNRVLVADSLADEFLAALAAEADRIVVGDGLDPRVTGGPTTTAAVMATAEAHIADAVEMGARVVAGGGRARGGDLDRGMFFRPTVLADAPLASRVMTQETFGPVVGVHRIATDAEAVSIANGPGYGLAAYVFGGDLDRAWGVAERLEAGGVGVNINDVTELQAPFGGWKLSGFGRELGTEGLQAMMQQRHIRLHRRWEGRA